MSNYPAGVSDSHPYFNPPRESATAVECGADEALVLPAHAVKEALKELQKLAGKIGTDRPAANRALREGIDKLIESLPALEQEREYECPFNDEVDLEESECARWNCPVCGNDRETDNLPEERDPDEEHDRDR